MTANLNGALAEVASTNVDYPPVGADIGFSQLIRNKQASK